MISVTSSASGSGATDPYIDQAIREILSTYGDRVSVTAKNKSLAKFGRSIDISDTTPSTVMGLLGGELNETFATTNAIDGVVSAGAGDTDNQVLTIEGHYYDGSNNLIFHVQDVTLTGQTKATLSQALCRATRAKVKKGTFASPATTPEGPVYVYASSGVTLSAGVPQTASLVKLVLGAGKAQTEKCATSISYQDYWILTGFSCAVQKGNASTVTCDFDIEYREQGGVFLPVGLEISLRSASESFFYRPLKPYVVIPSNSDVRTVALANTDNTTASARMAGVLAVVTD